MMKDKRMIFVIGFLTTWNIDERYTDYVLPPPNLLDPDLVVLLPVERHGGEVSGYQGVHPPTRTSQVGGRVWQGGPQAARQHSAHIDYQHLK